MPHEGGGGGGGSQRPCPPQGRHPLPRAHPCSARPPSFWQRFRFSPRGPPDLAPRTRPPCRRFLWVIDPGLLAQIRVVSDVPEQRQAPRPAGRLPSAQTHLLRGCATPPPPPHPPPSPQQPALRRQHPCCSPWLSCWEPLTGAPSVTHRSIPGGPDPEAWGPGGGHLPDSMRWGPGRCRAVACFRSVCVRSARPCGSLPDKFGVKC